ncbi:HET-domain-containing protein, partial [Setomelanomma holmii]
FWIDALSINQDDRSERGHQVNQMRAIYSGASEVVSWLGAESKDIDQQQCEIPSDLGMSEALPYLGKQSYWTRVWIVQELMSATNATLKCGAHCVTWSAIVQFIRQVGCDHFRWLEWPEEFAHPVGTVVGWLDGITQMQGLSMSPPRSTSLRSALLHTRTKMARDPRDAVYAIIGLIDLGAGLHMRSDYSRSPFQVYCAAIGILLKDMDKPAADKRY